VIVLQSKSSQTQPLAVKMPTASTAQAWQFQAMFSSQWGSCGNAPPAGQSQKWDGTNPQFIVERVGVSDVDSTVHAWVVKRARTAPQLKDVILEPEYVRRMNSDQLYGLIFP
jgi:hypothetical protein